MDYLSNKNVHLSFILRFNPYTVNSLSFSEQLKLKFLRIYFLSIGRFSCHWKLYAKNDQSTIFDCLFRVACFSKLFEYELKTDFYRNFKVNWRIWRQNWLTRPRGSDVHKLSSNKEMKSKWTKLMTCKTKWLGSEANMINYLKRYTAGGYITHSVRVSHL